MRSPPRILIVEDQCVAAVDCELYLRAMGMVCVGVVMVPAGALEVATRERPDLVVMDIHLPNPTDSIDAALAIYERLRIRTVFVVDKLSASMRDLAARAHPLAWVDRPYAVDRLVSVVRGAFEEVSANVVALPDPPPFARTMH